MPQSRSCSDQISVKCSKGIVGERGQKHLLKWQSFPCGSVVHTRFYISVRTRTKSTLITKKGSRGRDLLPSCAFERRQWRGVLDTALCDTVCQ
jgi:hypothetical protein